MYKTFSSERKNPISFEIVCLAFATEFLSFDRGEDWNVLTRHFFHACSNVRVAKWPHVVAEEWLFLSMFFLTKMLIHNQEPTTTLIP